MQGDKESVSEVVITEIIRQFEADLRRHLFSDSELPISTTVITKYPGCMQTLNVEYREIEKVSEIRN